jgi:hypothetical protein
MQFALAKTVRRAAEAHHSALTCRTHSKLSRIAAWLRKFCVPLAAIAVAGCGTYVPDHQEFWGTPNDTQIKVNKIAGQVRCELIRAVGSVMVDDQRLYWLAGWGAQVTLTLTIDEKSVASPGVTLNKVLPDAVTPFPNGDVRTPQSFTLGLGGSLSSDATRTDKLTMFFNFSDFFEVRGTSARQRKGILPRPPYGDCVPNSPNNADLFIQSDLKLRDWLYAAALPVLTGITDYTKFPTAPDFTNGILSHDIKFEIVSSGNINPTWTLVQVTGNAGSNPLFSTSRDRTQELLITLSPLKPGTSGAPSTPTQAALNSHLASEIGSAVAASIQATARGR